MSGSASPPRAVTVDDLMGLHPGDRVRFSDGVAGEVAFCVPSGRSLPDVRAEDFSICDGLMLRMPNGALVHYDLASFRDGEVFWAGEGAP